MRQAESGDSGGLPVGSGFPGGKCAPARNITNCTPPNQTKANQEKARYINCKKKKKFCSICSAITSIFAILSSRCKPGALEEEEEDPPPLRHSSPLCPLLHPQLAVLYPGPAKVCRPSTQFLTQDSHSGFCLQVLLSSPKGAGQRCSPLPCSLCQ